MVRYVRCVLRIRRAQAPTAPKASALPPARRERAILATDLQDLSFRRRAAPAALAMLAVTLADLLTGRDRYFAPLMVVVPSIAALTLRPVELLLVCFFGLLILLGLSRYDRMDNLHDSRFLFGALLSFVALSLVSAWVARLRMRRAAEFAAVSSVAEAAQRALLSQPGPSVGPLRLAVRYVSAADAARAG
jgi:hypothetical protein